MQQEAGPSGGGTPAGVGQEQLLQEHLAPARAAGAVEFAPPPQGRRGKRGADALLQQRSTKQPGASTSSSACQKRRRMYMRFLKFISTGNKGLAVVDGPKASSFYITMGDTTEHPSYDEELKAVTQFTICGLLHLGVPGVGSSVRYLNAADLAAKGLTEKGVRLLENVAREARARLQVQQEQELEQGPRRPMLRVDQPAEWGSDAEVDSSESEDEQLQERASGGTRGRGRGAIARGRGAIARGRGAIARGRSGLEQHSTGHGDAREQQEQPAQQGMKPGAQEHAAAGREGEAPAACSMPLGQHPTRAPAAKQEQGVAMAALPAGQGAQDVLAQQPQQLPTMAAAVTAAAAAAVTVLAAAAAAPTSVPPAQGGPDILPASTNPLQQLIAEQQHQQQHATAAAAAAAALELQLQQQQQQQQQQQLAATIAAGGAAPAPFPPQLAGVTPLALLPPMLPWTTEQMAVLACLTGGQQQLIQPAQDSAATPSAAPMLLGTQTMAPLGAAQHAAPVPARPPLAVQAPSMVPQPPQPLHGHSVSAAAAHVAGTSSIGTPTTEFQADALRRMLGNVDLDGVVGSLLRRESSGAAENDATLADDARFLYRLCSKDGGNACAKKLVQEKNVRELASLLERITVRAAYARLGLPGP